MQCHAPGCVEPGASKCSRCHLAHYCSAACQRLDWNAHKTACDTSSRITLLYTPALGTHVCAYTSVARGDVLLREQPFVVLGADDLENEDANKILAQVLARLCAGAPLATHDARVSAWTHRYVQRRMSSPTFHQNKSTVSDETCTNVARVFAANSFRTHSIVSDACTGKAFYAYASFFNHACRPNAIAVMIGTAICIIAAADIAPGAEVRISYYQSPHKDLAIDRRRHLARMHFECACETCARGEDGPRSFGTPRPVVLSAVAAEAAAHIPRLVDAAAEADKLAYRRLGSHVVAMARWIALVECFQTIALESPDTDHFNEVRQRARQAAVMALRAFIASHAAGQRSSQHGSWLASQGAPGDANAPFSACVGQRSSPAGGTAGMGPGCALRAPTGWASPLPVAGDVERLAAFVCAADTPTAVPWPTERSDYTCAHLARALSCPDGTRGRDALVRHLVEAYGSSEAAKCVLASEAAVAPFAMRGVYNY